MQHRPDVEQGNPYEDPLARRLLLLLTRGKPHGSQLSWCYRPVGKAEFSMPV